MYGFWSIIPPLVAVILAIVTRRVMISLFISIWVGGLIFTGGNPFSAVAMAFQWMTEVMIDPWNAGFLILVAMLGAGAAFMYKIGGSAAITKALEKKLTNGKRAQLLAYVLGVLVFFNDYVNSVIAGNASKDVNAKYRVSREKLAYVLDATAAPMATIGPVSDWIGYQVSLIAPIFVSLAIVGEKPYFAFLKSIPWNFYSILSLAAVLMIILGKDFGPMAKAELRAKKTGQLVAEGATPLSSVESDLGEPHTTKTGVMNFILPLITLIGIGIWAMWFTGGGAEGKALMDAIADTDVAIALTWAAFAMTVVGLILGLKAGMSISDCEETMLAGFKTMLPAIAIIILAWSIGTVTDVLGTADYVVSITQGWMTAGLLPFLLFVICMFIAFSTGTSWGTMAIMTPIGIPLAYGVNGLPLVYIAIGAIFAGAIFGDHVSPISDTTVMASIFAESDHIDHVRTQAPYAIVTALISGVLFLLSSFVGNGFILLCIGLVVQFFVYRYLGNSYQKKHFTEEEIMLLNDLQPESNK